MATDDVRKYLKETPKGKWYYYRRVPLELRGVTNQTHVKRSLKHAKTLHAAVVAAEEIHRATILYWQQLLAGNDNQTAAEQYEAAVKAAQSLGFTYRPMAEIIERRNVDEIVRRYRSAKSSESITVENAALGLVDRPEHRVSDIWRLYEEHNKAGLTGQSPKQAELHKQSRERALAYLKSVLGDVQLSAVTRSDALRFRDWWVEKIERERLKAYSANRSFSDIKGMLTVIDDALRTNFREPWDGLRVRETNATKLEKRVPFSREWIEDRILAPGALDGTNDVARCIVYVMAETGMRLGEVCNLRPSDIRLNDEVPHVEVAEREDRRQKTDHSVRKIPLVGCALWALKRHPNGFPRYADNSNSASAAINKALGAAGLRPTDRHTVYSLRHSFQDRIENAGASDRMQADLMGHEFGRPRYGDGAEMKRRREFLEEIKLRWEEPI